MTGFRASSLWKCLTAFLLAVVFIATPIADAHHSEDRLTIECEIDHVEIANPQGQASEHDHEHDHHTHKCGSCHIHMIGRDWVANIISPVVSEALRPEGKTRVATRPPGLLYRPPRA
ncbi:MAG: hypothetical protein CMK09_10890 [Ponticaulis sp.]|nr:hypothetical protein [Ponticaulis sp.]